MHKNAEKTAPFKSYPQSFFEGPVIYQVPWLSQGGASRVCTVEGEGGEEYKAHKNTEKTHSF